MASSSGSTTGQPLFIVDRDWLRQGPKARKSWTGNVRNRSLYGLPIEITQYDVPDNKTGHPIRKRKAVRKRKVHAEDFSGSEGVSEPEPSSRQAVPSAPIDQMSHDTSIVENSDSRTTNSTVPAAYASHPFQSALKNSVSSALSLSWPGFDHIRGLECYLDYYLDIIGTSQHPIENKFRFQTNTIRSSWFPLAFEDDLWLQNIAMFSALHHASSRNQAPPPDANALMSSFLTQLNDRISRSDLSDGTIASVSCLALGEHLKGNDSLSRVHAAGLAEMVRLRGGIETIQRSRRAKIVRADIVRSTDNLELPMLPRLVKNTSSNGPCTSSASPKLATKLAALARGGIAPQLISALWSLGSICQHLESAWAGSDTLDATAHYENVLCLNHDLLSFQSADNFNEGLRITLLNFSQPLFRYCAFAEHVYRTRSAKLQNVFADMPPCGDGDIAIWMTFTAYLFSQQTAQGPWFRSQLRTLLDKRGIARTGAWPQLKNILLSFLWTESIHEAGGREAYEMLERDGMNLSCHSIDGRPHCASAHHNFESKIRK